MCCQTFAISRFAHVILCKYQHTSYCANTKRKNRKSKFKEDLGCVVAEVEKLTVLMAEDRGHRAVHFERDVLFICYVGEERHPPLENPLLIVEYIEHYGR